MVKFIISLLSDSGAVSAGRFMALLSLFMGCGLAWYAIVNRSDLSGVAPIVTVFVTSAFAAKTISKYAENKNKDGDPC